MCLIGNFLFATSVALKKRLKKCCERASTRYVEVLKRKERLENCKVHTILIVILRLNFKNVSVAKFSC